ncbi:MAG: ribosome rescue protein RqcH [Nitrososphaeria archaeon]|nr:ribosome rescue protein RqcH [Nitrososphaeria archaeon]
MELSFIELKRLMREVEDKIVDSRIENVYHMEDKSIILKIRKNDEKYDLRIVPGKCFYLVRGEYKKPLTPTDIVLKFRRFLNNSLIKEIQLVEGERIIVCEIEKTHGEEYRLIIELLPKGTIILVDKNGKIIESLEKLKMRDRKIIPGEEYKLPPMRKSISRSSDIDEFFNSKDLSKKIVVGLALDAGLGRKYAEEVVFISSVDKSRKFSELSPEYLEKIKDAIRRVLESVETRKAVIVEYEDGEVEPLPYLLESVKSRDVKIREVGEFNEAVRIAYEISLAHQIYQKRLEKVQQELRELNKELENKRRAIQKLEELSKKKREIANLILTYSSYIEDFKKMGNHEEKSFKDIRVKLDISTKTILITSPIGEITLSISESIARQASKMFDEVKSIEDARRRLEREALELEDKIKKLTDEVEQIHHEELREISAKTTPEKKAWYEKYRWFYTSEGFLAVAGKDASSNHALIKKHLENSDLVFHAEIRGAPILILKNGVNSNESSRLEAAQFAGCYSKAWKEGLQSISVYYVKADQVSLTPPPGHYLPKGGVIIKGERNYLMVKLELGIGVRGDMLLWGPFLALSKNVEKIVKIVPGNRKARVLAEEILDRLFKEVERKKKIELIEKIVELIPYGCGEIY